MKIMIQDILLKLMFKRDNESPFLQERLKNEKVERLVANLHDNEEYHK